MKLAPAYDGFLLRPLPPSHPHSSLWSHVHRRNSRLRRRCALLPSSRGFVLTHKAVYNYWEPLHYLLYGKGFQTWEYSPVYAIRSWAFLLIHAQPSSIARFLFPMDKVRISSLSGGVLQ